MSRELKKVLYLEDDPHISEIAMMSLQDIAGLDVLHCSAGKEAIAAFEDFGPDILLFDVMLPDMDGVETLAGVRALENGTKTPVVFMTAKAQTHEQQQYLDLGALSVIVKPFDAFTLGDQLRSLWQSKRA